MTQLHYVAFEGLNGAGKSTLARRLVEQLRRAGLACELLHWNETPVAQAVLPMKKDLTLGAASAFLAELADFCIAWESGVRRLVAAQCPVLVGDRSAYTAICRGIVRGLDADWCSDVVAALPRPHHVFYVATPVSVCLERRVADGRPWSGFVSGEDFLRISDPLQRFKTYLDLLEATYERILPVEGRTNIGANVNVDALIREEVPRILASLKVG